MNLAKEYGSMKLFRSSSLKSRINLSIVDRVLLLRVLWMLFSWTLNIFGRSLSAAKTTWLSEIGVL